MHDERPKAGLMFRMIVAVAVAAGAAGPAAAQNSGIIIPGDGTGTSSTVEATPGQGSLEQGTGTDEEEHEPVHHRTGELHRDCVAFAHGAVGDGYELKAGCRVDDHTNALALTSTDLAAKIGADPSGMLAWYEQDFHRKCVTIEVEHREYGVRLSAECQSEECGHYGGHYEDGCGSFGRPSELWLQDFYEVDDSGRIVAKF